MQVSIVRLSELDAIAFRLDAEYYHPENLRKTQLIKKKRHKRIHNIGFVTDGIHESIDFDSRSSVRLISAKAPKENYFNVLGLKNISQEQHQKNSRTNLLRDDIIISSVGTIGNCAVVDEQILPANSDRHVGIIRLKDNNFKPRFISTFLLSKYGKFQSLRESTGNVQLNLFVYKINEIIIPELSLIFQELIERVCNDAKAKRKDGEIKYQQAQDLLLSELGLNDWQPKHKLTFIKNYSDIRQAERCDAEYFQPKYDEIVDAIKTYKGGWNRLENLLNLKKANFTPTDTKTYHYIELANIVGNGEITNCTTDEGQDLPTRARRKVNTGDVIVSSIEGSLSSIALIEDEYNNALCSTGFHVVSSEKLNSETILVLLKSMAGQLQLKKGCSGTILTAINQDEFGKIVLPKIPQPKQQEIQQKVTESFKLRRQSKQLLENAKRAVEIAIEEDEDAAIRWLKAQSP